jgi:hypothetical protein
MEIGHIIFTRNEDIQAIFGLLGRTAVSAKKKKFFLKDVSHYLEQSQNPKKKRLAYLNCGSAIVIFEKYLALYEEFENSEHDEHEKVIKDLVNNWNTYFSNELDIYRQDFYDCSQLIKKIGVINLFLGLGNASSMLWRKRKFKMNTLQLDVFDVKTKEIIEKS